MKFLSAFILFMVLSVPVHAASPIVVELFTSQFCPDAPPADMLFQSLVEEEADIIGISCHVRSFNNESRGEHDALSREFCDDRYGYYYNALGLGSFFVPLTVVNGRYDMAGEVEELVRSGVRMARVEDKVTPIDLRVEGEFLEFSLADRALPDGQDLDIWLFAYDDRHDVEISHVMTARAEVAYINAAEHLVRVKRWDGVADDFSFPLRDIAADGYAVLVQSARDGVLAAGRVRHYPMSVPNMQKP